MQARSLHHNGPLTPGPSPTRGGNEISKAHPACVYFFQMAGSYLFEEIDANYPKIPSPSGRGLG